MKIRADILEIANLEEQKLQFAEEAKEAEKEKNKVLTYEEYFNIDPNQDAHIPPEEKVIGQSKADTTYEQFLQTREG